MPVATPRRAVSRRSVASTAGLFSLGATLFVLSAGALAYEVLLTRLFSLVFQYHYAFLAVSLAVLGLGLGALVAYHLGFALDIRREASSLPWMVVTFALALPLASAAFNLLPSAATVILHVLVGLLPFVIVGLFSASVYAHHSRQGALLYAADLLGAAAGLGLSLFLLGRIGAFNAAFFLGSLTALATLLVASTNRQRGAAVFLALGLLVGLFANQRLAFVNLPVNMSSAPPDKVMFHVLSDPTRQARLIDSAWSPFARVDVVQTNDPDQLYVFTDGGAGSFMVRFDGNLQKVAWLRDQVEFLPFMNGSLQHTLILGAGAGKDILQARLAGSPQITAVEINPAIVDLTRKYASYNGGILDLPGVKTIVGDGRNFVDRAGERYDLIYLNLVYTQASEPGSAALSESYIFTEQAFRAYWNHLAPDGRLAIVSHQALEGSRALLSAVGSLEAEGFSPPDVLKRAVLFMYPNPDVNQRTSVMILSKTPWTQDDLGQLSRQAAALGMQPLYVPGAFETTMKGLVSGEMTLDQFISGDEYNLTPTTDDQPFFFNLYPGIPGPLKSLLGVVLAAALAYLVLFLWGRRKNGVATPRAATCWQLAYFGLLGLGFMLVEVPLIQRAILLLGNPTLALVVVVGGLLLSAGAGSLLSARWPVVRLLPWVASAALIVAGLALLALFLQPALIGLLLPTNLGWRVLAAGLMLVPLGIPMGVPFASGLRLVGRQQSEAVSLLWGWNAITSVLGSVLAAIIAILNGFSLALGLGAICYLALAGLAVRTAPRRKKKPETS